MAKNKLPPESHRKSAVKSRSHPITKRWTKATEQFEKRREDVGLRARPVDRKKIAAQAMRRVMAVEVRRQEFKGLEKYLSTDGFIDVDTVTTEFNLTKSALAQSLGFAEETLQRFSRVSAQKTQQRLREMLELLTRVEPWAGGMPQALGWYRGQGIPALGDQTAEALVKNDQAGVVRAYLDGIATGAFA